MARRPPGRSCTRRRWCFFDLRRDGLLLAQVFWGLWLFPLGYLVFRSELIPKVLGVLLIVGGAGYVSDAVAAMLWPLADVAISRFTFVGELLLPLWLLFKGVNVARWTALDAADRPTA